MIGSNLTESSPFLLLFLLGYCLAVTEGELRCYCNGSGCVSTSYMCKSTIGQCYTAVEVRGETTHQTHGCLDSLPEEYYASCRLSLDVISATSSGKGLVAPPLLLCCSEEMCNYIRDDYGISIILTPKYNGTLSRGNAPSNEENAVYSKNHHDDPDLWFKAAVIAVPIAGGFILVLLVLLAVHLLRTDSRHHRRLLQVRRDRSLTKAHMCITEYFEGKNSKQRCSLFNEKPAKLWPQLYSDAPGPIIDSSSTMYSPFNEVSGKQFSHPFQGDAFDPPPTNLPVARGSGYHHSGSGGNCHHSNTSLPCSSATCRSDATGYSRSTVGDACIKIHAPGSIGGTTKPCSFHAAPDSRPVSKGPCLGRDVTVKIDRSGHVHPSVMVSSSGQCHQGHPYTAVTVWDKAYAKGIPALV
uniref:BMP and activin membrane-bound inhibitor homolog n=1 Tax=Biomphalaria glabrata TaxID=6526 RepID=A0A2C9KL45_BIOGL